MNAGHGFKCFSEVGSEACNKLIRKYREHLARKTCFKDNLIDIFVRLTSESDPILVEYRSKLICDRCGEHGDTNRTVLHYDYTVPEEKSIESLVNSLIFSTIMHFFICCKCAQELSNLCKFLNFI